MEKDGCHDKKPDENQGDHGRDEPGGKAPCLGGRLGDAKGVAESAGEGLKKSHNFMVRRDGGRREDRAESIGVPRHPIR